MDSSSHFRARPVSPAVFDIHFSRGFLTDTHSIWRSTCCQLAQRYIRRKEKGNVIIKMGRKKEREKMFAKRKRAGVESFSPSIIQRAHNTNPHEGSVRLFIHACSVLPSRRKQEPNGPCVSKRKDYTHTQRGESHTNNNFICRLTMRRK